MTCSFCCLSQVMNVWGVSVESAMLRPVQAKHDSVKEHVVVPTTETARDKLEQCRFISAVIHNFFIC